ncbi:MAG: CYTH domain-containing protein [Lachnospiraceae bacterium]|nr:CYTH domain-containing protein [Lachnospiraceae bacterium]
MKMLEIEKKFLVDTLPSELEKYECVQIEQGYLCTNPVVRIRRSNQKYILTYKGEGLFVREEHNLPLTREGYEHLKPKVDGILIEKKRYKIPYQNYVIELDIFEGELASLLLAEVEFESEEEAKAFLPPDWFGEDVTYTGKYQNSYLSQNGLR